MKNLEIHTCSNRNLVDLETDVDLSQVLKENGAFCCVNSNNNDLYILSRNHLLAIPSEFSNSSKTTSVNIDIDENVQPIGIEYCGMSNDIFCAYESGDLIKVSLGSTIEVEHVAQIDGLQCMKLSPDDEILILVTTQFNVITMMTNFHVIAEVNLHSLDFGEKQFVTVGWGKKETQFHGSEGKAAAKKQPEAVNKTELDNGSCKISWRGDGAYFAVSFLHKDTGIRHFKVFKREGTLQFTSEPTNGLEETLAWRPSGSFIATSQRLPNKYVLAFFEKNGLKHREMVLPFQGNNFKVKDIFWSYDSEILTTWVEDMQTEENIIQLWTRNNYHWYLKQTVSFTKEDPLMFLTWSQVPRVGQQLILLTRKNLLKYNFRWTVNHSRGKNMDDKAVVGVIDGKKALVTGFRSGIVPPPMAHQSLEMEEPINSIAFAPNTKTEKSWVDSNCLFCTLESQQIVFFHHIQDSKLLEYEFIKSCNIEWEVPQISSDYLSRSMHHFLWFKENVILCSMTVQTQSYLCVLNHDVNLDKTGRVYVRETYLMDGLVEYIVSSPDPEAAYILSNGVIFKFTEEDELVPTGTELQGLINQIEIIAIGNRHVVLSLTNRNCFMIDGREVANNITSFFIHTEFLILTTLQQTLICVTLNEHGFEELTKQDLTVKPWENPAMEKVSSDFIRRVERGSTIVLAIPQDSKTILQMPRGNLECIQPRALSLHIIGTYLDNCNYLAAFDLIRKQRINLNLIYDHNPVLFLQNTEKFIDDITNPNWISLFLSELNEEDVTATTYSSCYENQIPKHSDTVKKTKVERVCELLGNIMESKKDSDNYIHPILISIVKRKHTKGLEAALRKIKEIKLNETSSKRSEEALKYLLYLIDVNLLFDIALGMYDFELTLFVASKSQKDPKEYLPFLNELKNMEENYRKYSIDKHLKRYESALEHISKLSENKFDECLDLIRTHSLYTKGLKLFKKDSSEYKEIAKIYSEYLLSNQKYLEAAIMFYRSGCLEKALHAYKFAGNWKDAIRIATELKLGPMDLNMLYNSLASQMKTEKRYQEAAEIHMNYLDDPENSVAVLCEGKHWQDALKIAYKVQRLDLIETNIQPGILEHADYIISQISKNREDFEKHKRRLAIVRVELANRRAQIPDGVNDYETSGKGVSDLLSDAGSVTGSYTSQGSQSSRQSGRSYRSGKNRRKQERKLLSIKEGSMFEDLALIRALHKIIIDSYAQRGEIYAVTPILLIIDHDELAEKLQQELSDFLDIIEESKSEIWNKTSNNESSQEMGDEFSTLAQFRRANIPKGLIEPHIMFPPERSSVLWKIDILSPPKQTPLDV